MSGTLFTDTITDNSPATATTTVGDTVRSGLIAATHLTIIATLTGGTGGTLDVYLQTSFDDGATWVDYAHFPQLTAGAAVTNKVWHVSRRTEVSSLTAVGVGTTATPSVALAANTIMGGAWGDRMRAVYVAGAGTSAGAAQVIKIHQWLPIGG